MYVNDNFQDQDCLEKGKTALSNKIVLTGFSVWLLINSFQPIAITFMVNKCVTI